MPIPYPSCNHHLRSNDSTMHILHSPKIPKQHPSSSCHHQARNVCTVSTPTAPLSCKPCILVSVPPSSLFWPSCGRRVSSALRIRIVCDRSGAFLGRLRRPRAKRGGISYGFRKVEGRGRWEGRTLPALYCVTLCCVCFLHVLPLIMVPTVSSSPLKGSSQPVKSD